MLHLVRGRYGVSVRAVACDPRRYDRRRRLRQAYHQLSPRTALLPPPPLHGTAQRGFGLWAVRAVQGVLRLRYLVMGGAVAGGSAMATTYEKWRSALPTTEWVRDLFPRGEEADKFFNDALAMRDSLRESVARMDLDGQVRSASEGLAAWLQQRYDDAVLAAAAGGETQLLDGSAMPLPHNALPVKPRDSDAKALAAALAELADLHLKYDALLVKTEKDATRIAELELEVEALAKQAQFEQAQKEEVQRRYDRLQKEAKEVRKSYLLLQKGAGDQKKRKVQMSLIDMYSDLLDELSSYDGRNMHDYLPRVVVVGDQSAGKTSVLEMMVEARIFPRGSGMMTRSPVMVTLSEGPYHVATFKDSAREFDLSSEQDLKALRREVLMRMQSSVAGGRSVSSDVVSMNVKGPGLPRMVFVDLPGVIATESQEQCENTRHAIKDMCKFYMANKNAIILCIQDGSTDVERSMATKHVERMDPNGERTICVLTKADMAEQKLKPDTIRKIFSGKMFKMKALNYFAVVTGNGNEESSIDQIRLYENEFFRKSAVFTNSSNAVVSPSKCTTSKLRGSVSERFWQMVKDTVREQADVFKATCVNLEREWKNNFVGVRLLDRDELFSKARGEVLDDLVKLSQVPDDEWSNLIETKLWERIQDYVFENIYIPAAQSENSALFRTTASRELERWGAEALPRTSVEVASEALRETFRGLLDAAKNSPEHDDIFDDMKTAIVEDTFKRHKWDPKAMGSLKESQRPHITDLHVKNKQQWDAACSLLEQCLVKKIKAHEDQLWQELGPTSYWSQVWNWSNQSEQQKQMAVVHRELEAVVSNGGERSAALSDEQLTTVKQLVASSSGYEVDHDTVRKAWDSVYRKSFLKSSLANLRDSKRHYFAYKKSLHHDLGIDCDGVVLFSQVQALMEGTTKSLKMQVALQEIGQLEKVTKEVLEDFGCDGERQASLLTGRRVELAEEIRKVNRINEKIEAFIDALSREK